MANYWKRCEKAKRWPTDDGVWFWGCSCHPKDGGMVPVEGVLIENVEQLRQDVRDIVEMYGQDVMTAEHEGRNWPSIERATDEIICLLAAVGEETP